MQPAYICLPSLNGAAGRSCTCIGSFRGRTPRLFRPRQHSEIGQRGRNCTCVPSVPSRVRWLLRYALLAPACSRRRSRRTQDTNLGNGPAVSSLKMADSNPDSESRLNPPTDNPDASRCIGTPFEIFDFRFSIWQAVSVPPRVSEVLETLPRADAQPVSGLSRKS